MEVQKKVATWLEQSIADAHYALKTISQHRSFTIVVVLTMALGIGASAAAFCIVDSVLLRDLPFEDSARLVSIWATVPSWRNHPALHVVWDQMGVTPNQFDELKKRQTVFDDISIYRNTSGKLSAGSRIRVGVAHGNFFDLLGVQGHSGRLLSTVDQEVSESSIVLDHGFCLRTYGAEAKAIGQQLNIDFDGQKKPYVVVGVLPQNFEFADYGFDPSPTPDVWIALKPETSSQWREDPSFNLVGRLKPGFPVSDAERETAEVLNANIGAFGKQMFGEEGARVVRRKSEETKNVQTSLFVLFGATALLLIVACSNVANLLLGRAVGRSREISVRTALGASRLRIIRLLVTESVLLSSIGGILGTAFAYGAVRILLAMSPATVPRSASIGIDGRVLLFVAAISMLTGILFGLAPALATLGKDIGSPSRVAGGTLGRQHHRLQRLILVGEIALTFILLVASALLTQSLLRLNSVRLGFHPEYLGILKVDLGNAGYTQEAQVRAFASEAMSKIRAVAGVEGVTIADQAPFTGRGLSTIELEGAPIGKSTQLMFDYHTVEPNYFEVVGVPIIKGRTFTSVDAGSQSRVMIINRTLERMLWPKEGGIDKRIRFDGNWYSIVGISQDVREFGLSTDELATYYIPSRYRANETRFFIVRSSKDPALLAQDLHRQVLSVDSDVDVALLRPLPTVIWESVSAERYRATIINVFAIVACALAFIGLYGVISRFVVSRRKELSVRTALGAQPRNLLWLVLRHSLTLTAVGVGLGAAAALATTQWLSSLLFGIEAFDVGTYAAVSVAVLSIALVATYLPARRAARTDPMVSLRAD